MFNDIVDILVRAVSTNANCPSDIGMIQCQYIGCALTVDAVINDPTCWNTSDGSIVLSSMNGEDPVFYSLDGGLPQGPLFTGVSAGPHSVVATDNQGCSFIFNFNLSAPDTIQVSFTTDSVSCYSGC